MSPHRPIWIYKWTAADSARALVGLILALAFLKWPEQVAGPVLDISQQSLYSYCTAHHVRFGREFCYIVGPLGFVVYAQVYAGYLYWASVSGQIVLQTLLATTLVMVGRTVRTRFLEVLLYALAFTILSAAPLAESPTYDLNSEWLLVLGALLLLRLPTGSLYWGASYGVLAGFLSLTKHTFALLAGLSLALVLVRWLWAGRRFEAVALGGAFLIAVPFWWVVSGQKLEDLMGYFESSRQIAAGYEAMALYELPGTTWLGLSLLMLAGMTLIGIAFARRKIGAVFSFALLGLQLLLTWRHGFHRADMHTDVFFMNAPVLLAISWIEAEYHGSPRAKARNWLPMVGTTVLTLVFVALGLGQNNLLSSADRVRAIVQHLDANANAIWRPLERKKQLEAKLEENRQTYALPQISQRVGNKPVDVWGYEQAVAILNGFNLRLRPMPAPLTAYNPWLLEKNRIFLSGAEAPRFIMMKMQPIDQRLATMEDALALREVLDGYAPVTYEAGWLLLEQGTHRLDHTQISRRHGRVHFGENVKLEAAAPGTVRFLRLRVLPSLQGKMLGAIYKLPSLQLNVDMGEPAPAAFRLMRENATTGFLLDPLVWDLQSFFDLLTGDNVAHPHAFMVVVGRGSTVAFQPEIEYTLETIPLAPLPAAP